MTLEEAKTSLGDYWHRRKATGEFLKAVLENNLIEAIRKADPESKNNLVAIASWAWMELPSPIWGNPAKVAAHLQGAMAK